MATKSQHSQFANYVLPTQFFNDPPSVVIPLIAPDKVTPGGRDVLVQLWEAASEFSTDNGGDSPDLGAIVSGIAGPYISLVVFPALGAFFAWGAAKLGD